MKVKLTDPNQDRPRVQYLGYQVKRSVSGVAAGSDVVADRKLTVQYPEDLETLSSIARKLRHLIEEDRYRMLPEKHSDNWVRNQVVRVLNH